ncbi:MAG: hypothetical protein JNK57_17775 [Planctomycetaceae bacterium]|nr:hypothetical protein [Planctomycetaceae bacterium]
MKTSLIMRNMLPRESYRNGLTLIEVLSSIAVAAIGVFGVLVLVPLASRMSQIGVSNEATRQNATNVVERAKSFGALNTNRWVRWDVGLNAYVPVTASPQGTYCLDPMLISAPNINAALPTTNTSVINVFPFTSGAATVLPTDRISVRRAPGATLPAGAAMAELMMGQRTMLKTVSAASDLVPPSQAFIRDLATNAAVRRETDGSKSALCLVLPTNQPGTSVHRLMSVVVANRRFETTNVDRVFNVLDPSSATPTVIRKPGGVMDLVLEEVDFNPAAGSGRPEGNLASRGWLILVPWYQNGAGVNVYYWEHARPYQIRSSDPDPANPSTRYFVGMMGAPFAAPSLTSVPQPHPIMPTRAIYVQDAVDIREVEVRLGTTEY